MEGLIMAKIIGICNLHDDPSLGFLTKNRPGGSVSFLGRYGLIDFTLSNFSNSHIEKVYVLVKSGMVQMRNHIGNGSIWTSNTKTGFIKLLMNEKGLFTPKFNTDIANMKLNLPLGETDFDYAVVAPSFMLTTMDYRPIIDAHIASGRDVTIVYTHCENGTEEFINCDRLKIDEKGKIKRIDKYLGKAEEVDVSLESFIISRATLVKLIEDSPKVSELYNLRQMISAYVDEGEIDAGGYKYEGFVAPILDFDSYVRHSFSLLNYHERNRLFLEDWPIYTTSHNTPPTLYGAKAKVRHSFIANGSVIKGKVDTCIISRGVVVEEGANLKNCIVFTDSFIGKGVTLKYVLTDKAAQVLATKELKGEEDRVVYIHQGAKI